MTTTGLVIFREPPSNTLGHRVGILHFSGGTLYLILRSQKGTKFPQENILFLFKMEMRTNKEEQE